MAIQNNFINNSIPRNMTPKIKDVTNNVATKQIKNKNQVEKVKIGASFATMLQEQIDKNAGKHVGQGLQLSKHAQERVNQRGIEITTKLMEEMVDATEKAQMKGVKDVVIFDSVNAFIVNVPSKTVVTAINGGEMRENVFTNIDGAIIL